MGCRGRGRISCGLRGASYGLEVAWYWLLDSRFPDCVAIGKTTHIGVIVIPAKSLRPRQIRQFKLVVLYMVLHISFICIQNKK